MTSFPGPADAPEPDAPETDVPSAAHTPTIVDDASGPPDDVAPPAPRQKRRRGLLVVLVILIVLLLGAAATGTWLFLQLTDARQQIDERNDRIDQQDDQIEQQQEQLDKKDSFSAAMAGLQRSIAPLAGLPFAQLVPWSDYDLLAARAWSLRKDPAGMDRVIADVDAATAEIAGRQEAARAQASGNASGTAWEATLDQLGGGWVATSIDDVSVTCDGDVLACVDGADPYVVHVDAASTSDETMTDWIRTGVAYHEFAHVLQFLNPEATESAVASFGGDWETMADCYSLTMLPGWTLDHEVPINEYEYWEVSVGYGYTCDEAQRQTIRDWTTQLGFQPQTIGG